MPCHVFKIILIVCVCVKFGIDGSIITWAKSTHLTSVDHDTNNN